MHWVYHRVQHRTINGCYVPNPSDPLAILLAGIVAVSGVVGYLMRQYDKRTQELLTEKDSRIKWYEDQLKVKDQREEAWRQEAWGLRSALADSNRVAKDAIDELKDTLDALKTRGLS